MGLTNATLREAAARAAAAGLTLRSGPELPRTGDFKSDLRIDFGKYLCREPAFVLSPTDREELRAGLRLCAELEIPVVTRAAAHSAGGQALALGGCLIDLSHLSRVFIGTNESAEPIVRAEGGSPWRAVVKQLRPLGLRPVVLTDNLGTTVGGTLSIGGIGDTSLHHGLQASHVSHLVLCTIDGKLLKLSPEDESFGAVLAGRGQLGVIVEAELRTLRRPRFVKGRLLRWRSLARFVDDALRARAHGVCEFFRASLMWPADRGSFEVQAIVGGFADGLSTESPSGSLDCEDVLMPDACSPLEMSDRYEEVFMEPPPPDPPHWQLPCVPLEAVFPCPEGVAAIERLCVAVMQHGLHRAMPLGAALALFPCDRRLVLAPQPATPLAIVLALRPLLAGPTAIAAGLRILRSLLPRVQEAGGRLYPCGIEPVEAQQRLHELGPNLETLRRLKQRFDPHHLLNPALLAGL